MIVFKTFYKIIMEYKFMLILYVVLLVGFTATNFSSSDSSVNFAQVKPDIVINDHDNSSLSKAIITYMGQNADIRQVDNVADALYYRDISYVINIPANYEKDFMNDKNPNIVVEANGDYNGAYANLLLDKFLKAASVYRLEGYDSQDISNKVIELLHSSVEVEVNSTIDTTSLSKASFFFNFVSYALLAGCVYVIAVAMSSFQNIKIKKRTTIGSMNNKKFNFYIFLSSSLLGVVLWVIYNVLAMALLNKTMFTLNGLLFSLNSLVFMFCCICIAFLVGNILKNKEAISGIVNVIALGSSFICGAFIPLEWIPDKVLVLSKMLPTYWYVQNNELISKLEIVDFASLQPILMNGLIVIGFMMLYIIITNIVSYRQRKIS